MKQNEIVENAIYSNGQDRQRKVLKIVNDGDVRGTGKSVFYKIVAGQLYFGVFSDGVMTLKAFARWAKYRV